MSLVRTQIDLSSHSGFFVGRGKEFSTPGSSRGSLAESIISNWWPLGEADRTAIDAARRSIGHGHRTSGLPRKTEESKPFAIAGGHIPDGIADLW